jgi:hypothetical protein
MTHDPDLAKFRLERLGEAVQAAETQTGETQSAETGPAADD